MQEADMSDTRFPRNIFLAILAAGILQCLHDYPLLPERMAFALWRFRRSEWLDDEIAIPLGVRRSVDPSHHS
jgi:hypothetical protein